MGYIVLKPYKHNCLLMCSGTKCQVLRKHMKHYWVATARSCLALVESIIMEKNCSPKNLSLLIAVRIGRIFVNVINNSLINTHLKIPIAVFFSFIKTTLHV